VPRAHIAAQFIAESALLALLGGIAGALLGGFATTAYAQARHGSAAVPGSALAAAVAAALAVGAVAGVYPALRAARLFPAEALRSP
jgi:putative ABC transport system permease protein